MGRARLAEKPERKHRTSAKRHSMSAANDAKARGGYPSWLRLMAACLHEQLGSVLDHRTLPPPLALGDVRSLDAASRRRLLAWLLACEDKVAQAWHLTCLNARMELEGPTGGSLGKSGSDRKGGGKKRGAGAMANGTGGAGAGAGAGKRRVLVTKHAGSAAGDVCKRCAFGTHTAHTCAAGRPGNPVSATAAPMAMAVTGAGAGVVADTTVCGRCGSGDDVEGNDILLCDRCPGGFHLQCVDPPLAAIPEGDWICPVCVEGAAFVGRSVRMLHGPAAINARVSKYLPPEAADDAPLWHVTHADGDAEDLERYELGAAIRRYERWEDGGNKGGPSPPSPPAAHQQEGGRELAVARKPPPATLPVAANASDTSAPHAPFPGAAPSPLAAIADATGAAAAAGNAARSRLFIHNGGTTGDAKLSVVFTSRDFARTD